MTSTLSPETRDVDVSTNGLEPPEPAPQRNQRAFAVLSRSWLFVFLIVLLGYFSLTTPSTT